MQEPFPADASLNAQADIAPADAPVIPEGALPPEGVPASPESAAAPAPEAPDLTLLRTQLAQEREQRLAIEAGRTRYQQAAAAYQQQAMAQQYDQAEQRMAAHLEQQGYLPEQAKQWARTQRLAHEQNEQLRYAAQAWQQDVTSRMEKAVELASQYGLAPKQLMQYGLQEMEGRAREMSRLERVERELANYKRGQVPGQTFANPGAVGGAASPEALMARYNRGDNLTSEEQKRLFNYLDNLPETPGLRRIG